MTFTTLTFFIFLFGVFAAYWGVRENTKQKVVLLFAGYIFYGWWDYRFCGLMLASSLADYTFGRLLAHSDRSAHRKLILGASCAFNLGLLGFFKYWNFFVDSLAELFQSVGWQMDVSTANIILPVGISFYTFQSMSYIIDVYRRQTQPTANLLDYLTFVAFFPQLLSGPIERARNLLPQLAAPRKFDEELAIDGLQLMLWGFFKKMVIADNLAQCVDEAYSHPALYNGPHLAFATVCFAFQIYGDFSGYSDIAVGSARLMGIRLMRNFAYPYFAQSVGEFWQRWHISLSTWFRDYVYFPLGGNRLGRTRFIGNVMITFLTSGLWHGAAWTYAFWGGLNGTGLLPKVLGRKHGLPATHDPARAGHVPLLGGLPGMVTTFVFICFTWIFFRSRTFADAFLIVWRIVAWPISRQASSGFHPFLTTQGLAVLIAVFIGIEWLSRERLHPLNWAGLPRSVRYCCYSLLIWLVIFLGPLHAGNFIYFQF